MWGSDHAACRCRVPLAAPHSYGYDAVNLIPALIWVLAEFSPFSTDAIVRRRAWTIVALWYASMSAAFVRPLLPDVVLRAGNLAVWIAIAQSCAGSRGAASRTHLTRDLLIERPPIARTSAGRSWISGQDTTVVGRAPVTYTNQVSTARAEERETWHHIGTHWG